MAGWLSLFPPVLPVEVAAQPDQNPFEKHVLARMKQRVVVIGHGYTSRLGLTRSLGKAGYAVDVIVVMVEHRKGKIDRTPPVDSYSRYAGRVLYCEQDEKQLLELLLVQCVEPGPKAVLIPDSDFSAAVIDTNQEKLAPYFLFPHIRHTPGAVVAWMNKKRQKETARKVGLPVAQGVVIEVVDGTYELPAEVPYPCFPKPLLTLVGAKTGMGRCDTEKELRAAIAAMAERSATVSVLVEECLLNQQEYALVGVSDGTVVHIPGILRIDALAGGGHFGVAKQGAILPVAGYETWVERFKAFVRETGFAGLFDIDFFQSGDQFVFCEMNFRYGGSGYAYTEAGVNLPQQFVTLMQGAPLDDTQFIESPSTYINERMCVEDWYKGYMTTRAFKALRKSGDIRFMADAEDPLPGRMFDKLVLRKGVRRLVKRCIGK